MPWNVQCARRYYVYDLGTAVSTAAFQLGAALLLGRQQRSDRMAHHLPGYCCVQDVLYSSLYTLLQKPGSISCEIHSAVYTVSMLTGHELPLMGAAAGGNYDTAMRMRQAAFADPASLPGVHSWPQQEQQLACAALSRIRRLCCACHSSWRHLCQYVCEYMQ
jgi:hypothetical protein